MGGMEWFAESSFYKKLINADNSLFSWVKKQPEYSFQQMNPDAVALVHMTNFFSKNGEILVSVRKSIFLVVCITNHLG